MLEEISLFTCLQNVLLDLYESNCCGSFGTYLDCMLLGIKSLLGLGFFLHSSMFQLHVYDSLYSQALAFSQVPSGIEENKL